MASEKVTLKRAGLGRYTHGDLIIRRVYPTGMSTPNWIVTRGEGWDHIVETCSSLGAVRDYLAKEVTS